MRFFVFNKKQLIFAVLAAAAVIAVCLGSGRAVMTFLVGGREIPIYSVERSDNKIALTFDCAWGDEDIDAVIDALSSRNCGATFFVTGKWAEDHGSSLNKLYRAGFEIGTHSYNHADYTELGSDEIIEDTERSERAVRKVTGAETRLMRAPSGAYNDNVVRTIEDSGRTYVQWSVDGLDYGETTADEIYSRVAENTESGDIILLHCGTEHTAEALPRILDTLTEKYELVTVSELIYKDNYVIDHAGRQSQRQLY